MQRERAKGGSYGTGLAAMFIAIYAGCGQAAGAGERGWLPEDLISMRRITYNQHGPEWRTPSPDAEPIVESPDGRAFFFVQNSGSIQSDAMTYEIKAFGVAQVLNALKSKPLRGSLQPMASAAFQSFSSSKSAVRDARWDSEGDGILFSAMSDGGLMQPHRLVLSTGEVQRLASGAGDMDYFGYGGGTFIGQFAPSSTTAAPVAYPAEAVARENGAVLMPDQRASGDPIVTTFSRAGEAAAFLTDYPSGDSWVSPDGRKAVTRAYYGGREQLVIFDLTRHRPEPLFRIGSIDFENTLSHTTRISNSPAIWDRNGERVILIGVQSKPADFQESQQIAGGYIGSFEFTPGAWHLLEPLVSDVKEDGIARRVSRVGWLSEQQLLVEHQVGEKRDKGEVYDFRAHEVGGRAVPSSMRLPSLSSRGVSVQIREDANQPARVVASRGASEVALTEPDPAISSLWLAEMKPFRWRNSDGTDDVAGLMLPRGASARSRIPLVIQWHSYLPEYFLPDGPNSGPDAAQALAARGMAVLQMNITQPGVKEEEGGREGDDVIMRLEAAIQELERQGIVDETRVGITGFSHAGYQVLYATTHPKKVVFAAAVCADSFTGGYPTYLLTAALGLPMNSFEKMYKGSFWKQEKEWLEAETLFNVNRVRTPILFTQNGATSGGGPYSVVSLQTMGAFILNDKPFEFLFFPQAFHQLQRPDERLVMMQAVVDWMAYWLQNYEDPSPEKAVRYQRWRSMRTDTRR